MMQGTFPVALGQFREEHIRCRAQAEQAQAAGRYDKKVDDKKIKTLCRVSRQLHA